jgi:hypothetical protein
MIGILIGIGIGILICMGVLGGVVNDIESFFNAKPPFE